MLTKKNCRYHQLRKYLKSRIEQQWDDIYSDLSKLNVYDLDDMIQWIVELKPIQKQGQLYNSNGSHLLHRELYVCNGILKYIGRTYTNKKNKPIKILWSDKKNLKQIHRIKGIWYEITVAPYQVIYSYIRTRWGTGKIRIERSQYDRIQRYAMTRWEREKTYGGMYKGISKHQLNSKEIKRVQLAS